MSRKAAVEVSVTETSTVKFRLQQSIFTIKTVQLGSTISDSHTITTNDRILLIYPYVNDEFSNYY